MKCKDCNSEIEGDLKYIAYYAGEKAIYWKKCENCILKDWFEYKDSLKEDK